MELHERIKELRKNYLHMSQTDFGERLGVSRSVINNIERNVLARPDQKLSLMKLICSEFNVNEEWLLNGTEPMFVQPDTFSLDQFVRDHQGTDLEIEIMKAYFELDPDIRKTVLDHFKARFSAVAQAETAASEPSVEDLEAEYKKSVLGSAQKTGFTASSTTEGTAVTGGQTDKVSNQ
ncbi:transcriptional regulator [[Clostridium] symbiosum]|uniref:helix-turn-helix transcriptional regulator n=1 Tax=Clostridium symbiosum TaxID=1512 RepID=UPI0006BFCE1E|nr:helix-turn-helix transcriptional regulator [[Clostridium] symbiosum]CUO39818.1 transcriptional regulator [[Clostridium] symbiosum]